MLSPAASQDGVHGIQDICPHHGHLVNDEDVHIAYDIKLGTADSDGSSQLGFVGIGRHKRGKWKLKQAVECCSTGIDSSDARRCRDDQIFSAVLTDMP